MMAESFWAPEDDHRYQILKEAAITGNEVSLKTVLKSDIRLDAQFGKKSNHDGTTALHLAAFHGHASIVRLLLANGVDVNVLNEDVWGPVTPLYSAAAAANAETSKILLDAGARIDVFGPTDESLLSNVFRFSARHTNETMIRILDLFLRHGVDVNMRKSQRKNTALDCAVVDNNQEVIRFLLNKGASAESSLIQAVMHHDGAALLQLLYLLIDTGTLDSEHAAVTRAAYMGKVEAVKLLLNIQPPGSAQCSDPVCEAAKHGHVEILQMLLDFGFPINKAGSHGLTPLHQAVRGTVREADVVQFLLDRGADVLALTIKVRWTPFNDGETTLHTAAERCHLPIIEKIIEVAPSLIHLRLTNIEGCGDTPLLTFARCVTMIQRTQDYQGDSLPARVRALAILLDAGANINDCDQKGRTALHILASNKSGRSSSIIETGVQLLLQRGASTRIRDRDGNLPRDIASSKVIKAMLEQHGEQGIPG